MINLNKLKIRWFVLGMLLNVLTGCVLSPNSPNQIPVQSQMRLDRCSGKPSLSGGLHITVGSGSYISIPYSCGKLLY